MLFILSPAKTLDMAPAHAESQGAPQYAARARQLAAHLGQLSKSQLQSLLEVSASLADLNYRRYRAFNEQPSKAAVLAFNGDAYVGLSAKSMSKEDLAWAQSHLRILSGLYGILRPLDPIQPFRLNMGTKLKTDRARDLYEFWGDSIALSIGEAMEAACCEPQKDKRVEGEGSSEAIEKGERLKDELLLVNAASMEYFKAVKLSALPSNTRVVETVFQEANGKIVSVFAKKARGMLVRFAILNRITTVEGLKAFKGTDGEYSFRPNQSSEDKLVFVRKPSKAKAVPANEAKMGQMDEGINIGQNGEARATRASKAEEDDFDEIIGVVQKSKPSRGGSRSTSKGVPHGKAKVESLRPNTSRGSRKPKKELKEEEEEIVGGKDDMEDRPMGGNGSEDNDEGMEPKVNGKSPRRRRSQASEGEVVGKTKRKSAQENTRGGKESSQLIASGRGQASKRTRGSK